MLSISMSGGKSSSRSFKIMRLKGEWQFFSRLKAKGRAHSLPLLPFPSFFPSLDRAPTACPALCQLLVTDRVQQTLSPQDSHTPSRVQGSSC